MGLRIARASFALIPVIALVSCSSQPVQLTDSAWFVTDVYTNPEQSSAVSGVVTEQPRIDFGRTSVSGFTGCVPFHGLVSYANAEGPSDFTDAESVSFTDLDFADVPEECGGQDLKLHEELTTLLPHEFSLSRKNDGEVLLSQKTGELNKPSIRLVSPG